MIDAMIEGSGLVLFGLVGWVVVRSLWAAAMNPIDREARLMAQSIEESFADFARFCEEESAKVYDWMTETDNFLNDTVEGCEYWAAVDKQIEQEELDRIAYDYVTGLDDGDLEKVGAVLEAAVGNPAIDEMVEAVNEEFIKELNANGIEFIPSSQVVFIDDDGEVERPAASYRVDFIGELFGLIADYVLPVRITIGQPTGNEELPRFYPYGFGTSITNQLLHSTGVEDEADRIESEFMAFVAEEEEKATALWEPCTMNLPKKLTLAQRRKAAVAAGVKGAGRLNSAQLTAIGW